ncbi:MAG: PD-(D/E)XK nuclease family protein, partial [Clostridia bacterium]
TRAKEKLFFVASDKNILDKIEKSKADSILNDNIHQYLAQNKNNYFDWIMTSIVKHKAFNSVTTKKDNIIFDEKLGFAINTYYIKDIDNSKKNEIVPKEKENPSTNNYKSNNIIKLLSFTYPYKESEKYLSKISVSSLAKENNQSVFQEEIYVPNFEKNKIGKSNPIIKGNAVHKFLQIADFNQSKNNLNEYALNLVKTKQLSQQYYNSINFSSIQKFLSSNLAKKMINSKKIYKEAELLHKIKLKEIFNGINDESKNDEIIIQGIADCIFKSSSNMWILVDYKTDKLKNESEFVDRYKNQLLIYKMAAEYLIKEKIEKTIIYSFHLNKEIEIN